MMETLTHFPKVRRWWINKETVCTDCGLTLGTYDLTYCPPDSLETFHSNRSDCIRALRDELRKKELLATVLFEAVKAITQAAQDALKGVKEHGA